MLTVAHDHQLRTLLRAHLSPRLAAEDLLVDELPLAFRAVRADVALVNGHLEGFEIKAGTDTLKRLPAQLEGYEKVFEYLWIVTTKTHLAAVRSLAPPACGLMLAHCGVEGAALRLIRRAKRNAKRDPSHLVRLLWRDEVLAKLEALGLSRGLKTKPKIALFSALAQAMAVDDLADYVRLCLKARGDWRADRAPREGGGSSRHDAKS
jgi:hypothetical protein